MFFYRYLIFRVNIACLCILFVWYLRIFNEWLLLKLGDLNKNLYYSSAQLCVIRVELERNYPGSLQPRQSHLAWEVDDTWFGHKSSALEYWRCVVGSGGGIWIISAFSWKYKKEVLILPNPFGSSWMNLTSSHCLCSLSSSDSSYLLWLL